VSSSGLTPRPFIKCIGKPGDCTQLDPDQHKAAGAEGLCCVSWKAKQRGQTPTPNDEPDWPDFNPEDPD